MKKEKLNSGKSKSNALPDGKRRRVQGEELAPRSARRKGRYFLAACDEKDLKIANITKGNKE